LSETAGSPALALNHGIDHTREKNLRSEDFINKIISLQPDLFVSAHFEKLLSYDLIRIPSKGAINLHPSLLPDYRGLAPQHWPIINGDAKTGVTVHFIDETADTGDIIIQKEIDIEKDDYVIDLQKKML
jgi:methionyl-tRNA formyltransferase